MPHFSFPHDMHAFEGVELVCDYRFSGTYTDAENYTFDTVEVMGRGLGLSWDGYRTITRLHPLHRAADAYLDTQDADEQAKAVIRAEIAERRHQRRAPVALPLSQAAE